MNCVIFQARNGHQQLKRLLHRSILPEHILVKSNERKQFLKNPLKKLKNFISDEEGNFEEQGLEESEET
jgi:hypothetical protein